MKRVEWTGFVERGLEAVELEARIKELLALQDFLTENGELDEVSRDAATEWSRRRIAAHRQTLEALKPSNA